jgi:hypothetical protein
LAVWLAVLTTASPVLSNAQVTQPVYPATTTVPATTSTYVTVTQTPAIPVVFAPFPPVTILDTTKPVVTNQPVTITGTAPGGCAPQSTSIVQDCTLRQTNFESNVVNAWLSYHGLPLTDAPLIYQYATPDVRAQIRALMFQYIQNVISETAPRSVNDQAVYNWISNAVQKNENAYYKAFKAEYNRWQASPCTFALNPTVASAFGLSYTQAVPSNCGASISTAYTSLSPPDVSYFKEVAQLNSYDTAVSSLDVNAARVIVQAQQQMLKIGVLASLGPSIAFSAGVGAVINANIATIAPYLVRTISVGTEEAISSAAEAAEVTAIADSTGPVGIVLLFIEIGVTAAISLQQTDANQNAINDYLNYNPNQPPPLATMIQDNAGYQKLYETFITATLPDVGPTSAPPAPNNPIVFYSIGENEPSSGIPQSSFSYTTADPTFPQFPANYSTFTVQSYGNGWLVQNNGQTTLFDMDFTYTDFSNGNTYQAEKIDKGRFLLTKVNAGLIDIPCPADPVLGVSVVANYSDCSNLVTNNLNIQVFGKNGNFYNVSIAQPPVFVSPPGEQFVVGKKALFVPELDSTANGPQGQNPRCIITATGDIPSGITLGTYNNNPAFVGQAAEGTEGTHNVTLTATCAGASTTQAFTINVLPGASPPQFSYPTSSTNLSLTLGKPVNILVRTQGGVTSITAGANAVPAGLTLTDNGNGSGIISGTPSGPAPSCTTTCDNLITASRSSDNATTTLALNYTLNTPSLPNIPAMQSVAWNAGVPSTFVIDGSLDSNNSPVRVPLTWSALSGVPSWATFTDKKNNMAFLSGNPPASAYGKTYPVTFDYTYAAGALTSQQFTIDIVVGAPTPVLAVNPPLLFQVNTSGSGAVNSSTLTGGTGLSGTWSILGSLPAGLTSASSGASLTISGTPIYPGSYQLPVQFIDSAGDTNTRNVALLITQPASLSSFPARIVLFKGVATNLVLPVSAGFPLDASNGPGDGLPSTSGTSLQFTGTYPTGDGFAINSNGASLEITGTPVATEPASQLNVTAQTTLSTGPVGGQASQSLTIYVQPAGDVNLDGLVDCNDYALVKQHMGSYLGQANYSDLADANHDGRVDVLDLAFVQSHLPRGAACH